MMMYAPIKVSHFLSEQLPLELGLKHSSPFASSLPALSFRATSIRIRIETINKPQYQFRINRFQSNFH